MTEIELTELRDSLVTINSELDALDVRVTALEDNAVPKGTYFNQLKASFENSPECCECEDAEEPPCNCNGATSTTLLRTSGDFEDIVSVEINGVLYDTAGGAYFIVPSNIATFTRDQVANTDIDNDWTMTVLNTSNVPLCVVLNGYSVSNYLNTSDVIHPSNPNTTVVHDTLLDKVTFCLAVA